MTITEAVITGVIVGVANHFSNKYLIKNLEKGEEKILKTIKSINGNGKYNNSYASDDEEDQQGENPNRKEPP